MTAKAANVPVYQIALLCHEDILGAETFVRNIALGEGQLPELLFVVEQDWL